MHTYYYYIHIEVHSMFYLINADFFFNLYFPIFLFYLYMKLQLSHKTPQYESTQIKTL